MPNSLSSDQLHRLARLGARARLEEVQTEIAAIQALIGERAPARRPGRARSVASGDKEGNGRRRRGKLSAAGRARIAAAQRARWAKIKAAKGGGAGQGRKPSQAAKGKIRKRRSMSAAARKAVGERMKKYWAARRKAKKAA